MMLVVDPSSTCDVCLEPYEWDGDIEKTPHLIPCGHIFCLQCLQRIFPPRCPMCRKLYLATDMQKLHVHVDCVEDDEKNEETDLLKRLVVSSDASEEDILRIRIEVDTWLEGKVYDEASPLRKARDALENYQQLKLKSHRDRKKIRILEKAARHWEKTIQDNAIRQQAEATRKEETLLNQISQQQAEIARLKAELASKRTHTLDRSRKKQQTHPLIINENPLPEPPRLVPPPTWSMAWDVRRGIANYGTRNTHLEGMAEADLDADDEAAFYTCRSRPAWLEDDLPHEPILQRPQGNYF